MNTIDETNTERQTEPSETSTHRRKTNGLKPNGLTVPLANGKAGGGSTASMRDMNLLENIIDWQGVIRKYKAVVKISKKDS